MPEIATSRSFGDTWVKTKRSPILSVPSVVVPHQMNYLINPDHPDIVGSIKVVEQQSFMLDVRLFSALVYP